MWGHRYEACYDINEYLPPQLTSVTGHGMAVVKDLKNYDKIYVKHVCVRCGSTVKREE